MTLDAGASPNPLISVIVPSFNCAKYLGRAIDSILGQSMPDFEVIVVDDGSSDGTFAVVAQYQKHASVRYLHQSNKGPSAARNHGLKASQARYVMFVDADDALPPGALATIESAITQTGASWCVTDVLRVSDETPTIVRSLVPVRDLFYGILADDFIRRGVFFRREDLVAIGGYDETLTIREDWDLNIRMIEGGKRFLYIPSPLYIYSWRAHSLTTCDPSRILGFTWKVLIKHHKRLADSGDAQAARIYAAGMWDLGRRYLHQTRNFRQAAACVRESLAYDLNLGRFFHAIFHQIRNSRQSA